MKTLSLVLFTLTATFLSSQSLAEEKAPDPITVRIVPESLDERGEREILLLPPPRHFHVVLTNVAKEPIRLWREWCSWGYSTLSFEATDQSGKTVNIMKKPREWNNNYPDWTIIPPGDHMVFDVTLNESIWKNVPLPEAGKSRVVKLKAIFEIPNDKYAKEKKVWTGRVASPEYTYIMRTQFGSRLNQDRLSNRFVVTDLSFENPRGGGFITQQGSPNKRSAIRKLKPSGAKQGSPDKRSAIRGSNPSARSATE